MGAPASHRSQRLLVAALLSVAALLVIARPARAESQIVVREGGKRLVAISPTTGRARTLALIRHGAILGTAASRDGRVLAYATRTFATADGHPLWTDRLWLLRPGERPRLLRKVVTSGIERGRLPINSLAISPDGTELLFQTNSHAVFVMPTAGGRARFVDASREFGLGEGRNSGGPEFTADGRRILATFYPKNAPVTAFGGIGTVSIAGGPVHLIAGGPAADGIGNFAAPTESPDGRLVAFELRRRSGDSIWVMDADGSHRHRVLAVPGWNIGNPTFSPSGRALAFVGNFPLPHRHGTVIGVSPAALFTVRLDGSHLRFLHRETARLFDRDPTWVRWSKRWADP